MPHSRNLFDTSVHSLNRHCFKACHVCHTRIAGEAGLDVGCGSEWERGESVELAIHSGDTSIPAAVNADYVSVTTGKTEMSGTPANARR